MSRLLSPPYRELSGGRTEENKIREIFYQHWEKIKKQMEASENEIDSWRDRTIAAVNDYANQQLRNLKNDYDRQLHVFDDSRRANIDTVVDSGRHTTIQSDLFNQICKECHRLEFKVAQLETISDSMDYIKVITVEDQAKKKQENPTVKQNIKADNNKYGNGNSSTKPASTSSDRTNRQQSSVSDNSSSDKSRIVRNSNQQTGGTEDDGDLDAKCPICFMIYPSSMNHYDRSRHANEHYNTDDN